MSIELSPNTPLADAINRAIQPKLVEVGWGTGGPDDAALAEYIVLMLVNGKTQDEIAAEISGELLSLGPEDTVARDFAGWLFREIESLNAQINGAAQQQPSEPEAMQIGESTEAQSSNTSNTGPPVPTVNAPTGPRSMRNPNNFRGGRDKRMMGQMNKAMDRSHDVLRRVHTQTGNERINTHNRGPPTGPRTGLNRQGRPVNGRLANNIQAGMAAAMGHGMGGPMPGPMPGMPGPPNGMAPGWPMVSEQPSQAELMNLLQQQSQMMQQISQQMMSQGANGGFQQNRHGRQQRSNFRRGGGHQPQLGHHHVAAPASANQESAGQGGEDVDMAGPPKEPTNPEDHVCKFNLRCTNKDCKFAHQSPAAPPGTTVDMQDVCTFGAACKNWKCVGKHPSPANRAAHQSEQDCKFFPNCQNPRCSFRHPTMPLCRNGADCTTPGCKFTHVKTKCRFNPCLNPNCAFAHEEGQQGGFKDKVWTPEGGTQEHVSERKFVDAKGEVEMVVGEDDQAEDTIS